MADSAVYGLSTSRSLDSMSALPVGWVHFQLRPVKNVFFRQLRQTVAYWFVSLYSRYDYATMVLHSNQRRTSITMF